MRKVTLLIALFYFLAQNVNSQIIRANPFYRPFAVAFDSLMLDTYTGSVGAYSAARKLRGNYSGNCIRIRRSSDNTESDIGFSGNQVDTSAIKSFCGSGDGFIVTFYDQQGSNNVSQSTSSAQARICSTGVIDRVSGRPSAYFDGNDGYNFSPFAGKTRMDFYFLVSTSDNSYVQFYGDFAGLEYGFVGTDGDNSTVVRQSFGTPTLYANNSTVTTTRRNDIHDGLNGTKIVTIENSTTSVWGTVCRFGDYSGFEYVGYLSEIIGWDSDQSSNRSGIISNINTFYSIY